MYDLSDVLDAEALSAVRPGSSLLISGPVMTGKEHLLFEILADGLAQAEGAVGTTTGNRATEVAADIESRAGEFDPGAVTVIDCRADGSREEAQLESGVYAHHVGDPSDLTGIGIGVTQSFERLADGGYDHGRFGLADLSTMLTYADEETVFKFCHVLSSRLDAAEFLGAFTIDSSAHDDRTIQVIKQAFDGQIQLRERDGRREARVRGLGGDPSEWLPIG